MLVFILVGIGMYVLIGAGAVALGPSANDLKNEVGHLAVRPDVPFWRILSLIARRGTTIAVTWPFLAASAKCQPVKSDDLVLDRVSRIGIDAAQQPAARHAASGEAVRAASKNERALASIGDPELSDAPGESMKNLVSAAERGDGPAQLLLGKMYLEERLPAGSLRFAVYWLRKASTNGTEGAEELLRRARIAIAGKAHSPQIRDTGEDPNQLVNRGSESFREPWRTFATEEVSPRQRGPSFAPANGEPIDKLDFRLLALGISKGSLCLARAEEKTHLGGRTNRSQVMERAIEMAAQRDWTALDSDRGISSFVDGSDPLFEHRRAVFIRGLRMGIDGADADEIAERIKQCLPLNDV